MIKYILTAFLLLLSSCASSDRTYFTDTATDKSHAKLYMEPKDADSIHLFGITVAAIKPLSINGLPVDAKREYWKLHAFGEFIIPTGDTMIVLEYNDRDNRDRGFVRFTARAGKSYWVTHRMNDTFIHFDVIDEASNLITTQTFYKWQYIWEKTPEEEALLFAAQQGDLAQVNSLLKQGVNPNWSGAYRKFKPVTVAAANGYYDIVEALIKAGADINPVNQITPLEAACMHGHIQVVELLLKHGAYPDLGTPLIRAVEHEHGNIVQLLLQKGAYTLSRNHAGLTALEIAQQLQNQPVIHMLQAFPH